ncbi:hypothetical protein MaudCBS49596_002542 [Microsporum audouinii]
MVSTQLILSAIVLFGVSNTSAAALRPRDCSFMSPAATGDTCQSLASDWGINVSQFIQWNAGVDCNALVVGRQYCILWAGAEPSSVTTSSTPSSRTTSTTTSTTTSATTSATTSTTTSATTSTITSTTVSKTSMTTSPAMTTPATPPGPSQVQGGIATDCQRYHQVKSGDSCQNIVDTYKTFTLNQFYSWNPAVGKSCESLWLGYYVCIGVKGTPTTPPKEPNTPKPTQPNVNPKCNKWYKVVSGDYCQKISDQFHIPLQDFYKWNPDVGNACASLWADYNVCVGSA